MAGMRVVVVACDDDGNVDVDDLRAKLPTHAGDRLSCLMVTYPSTHGVFEEAISEICDLVHEHGGQVYLDGANLNALVGVAQPGPLRRRRVPPQPPQDVLHPPRRRRPRRRAGRRCGATCRRSCPTTRSSTRPGPATGAGAISAAPWGSAGILPDLVGLHPLMGGDGLREATEVAILAANYIAHRLAAHYPVLYTGRTTLVAHECILDIRRITSDTGVTRRRHRQAPHRLRLPRPDHVVPGGRHADGRADRVGGAGRARPLLRRHDRHPGRDRRGRDGRVARRRQPPAPRPPHRRGRRSPTTGTAPTPGSWPPIPSPALRAAKYWPPVSRIDGGYGDRNVVCSCPPLVADLD